MFYVVASQFFKINLELLSEQAVFELAPLNANQLPLLMPALPATRGCR